MATDAQIRAESYWRREEVPVPLDKLVDDLCVFYRVPRTNGGTKGNEAHRKGRHRSAEWCLKSAFCTNPSYGTTDARDKRGNPRHIRAFDFEFKTDAEFWAACHRLDDAVRAGRLPQLAEWFGTFDGRKVVGWFEGRPGTADSSHLKHLHGGLWTESADDPAALAELFDIITGEDMATPIEIWTHDLKDGPGSEAAYKALLRGAKAAEDATAAANRVGDGVKALDVRLDSVGLVLADVAAKVGTVTVTDEQLERVMRKVLGGLDGATPEVPA